MNTTYLKLGLAILFLVCLFNMPYGYYRLVRFLGMVGFAVLAYQNFQKNQTWFVIWLASAVLINPFFKVSIGRTLECNGCGMGNITDLHGLHGKKTSKDLERACQHSTSLFKKKTKIRNDVRDII